jgi:hypothetical protein
MSKIRAFVAAVLVSIPMMNVGAAQLSVPQGAAPFMSDPRPTTANGCCFYIWYNGLIICIFC